MVNRNLLFVVLMSCCLLPACRQSPPEKPRDHVTLQLKWLHQAQFAGFYMAQEKGYYQDENLDVSFLEGGKDIDQCQQIVTGKADLALTSAETIFLKRTEEHRMVALAVIYQRSAVVFASKKQSHIVRPQDFVGKTIAVGGMEGGGFVEGLVQFQALIKKMGLSNANIAIAPYDPLYRDFLAGKIDITPTYLTAGVIKMRNRGIDLNLIWPGDYGIPFYSDTLIATPEYLSRNRDIALRFLRASLRGWREAIEHPDEAVDMTLKYTELKDRKVQEDMIEAQMPLVHTGEHPIGWMEPKIWQGIYATLLEQGILQKPIDHPESVYTLDLLKAIYSPGEQ
jgi:NitT/TauT family transport system substrate-binding protein